VPYTGAAYLESISTFSETLEISQQEGLWLLSHRMVSIDLFMRFSWIKAWHFLIPQRIDFCRGFSLGFRLGYGEGNILNGVKVSV